jgi:putative FmdB family regulatory protein
MHWRSRDHRRMVMPRYEFMCDKCQKPFELAMTMSAREKAEIKCPDCNGTKVRPLLGSFLTQTSKKS